MTRWRHLSSTNWTAFAASFRLGPQDHVLEIGTGWGGFAEHAVEHYGCRVTSTTISNEQFAYATQRLGNRPRGDY